MSEIHGKLKKLLALANGGVGGERANAQAKLAALMRKHGVSMEDLGVDTVSTNWFKRKRGPMMAELLDQVIFAVAGKCKQWRQRSRPNLLGVDCTVAERIEIELRFDAYARGLKDELKIFYSAFIHKNGIFPAAEDDTPPPELTQEELERLKRISLVMMGMKHVQVRRQIEGAA